LQRKFARLWLCACVFLFGLPAAAQSGLTVIGTSGDTIRTIDLVSGSSVSHPIAIPGKTVGTTFGLARDPQTGTVYAVVNYFQAGGRFLATVDPATGAGTNIGQAPIVSDITFGADGTLYGIGGNNGGPGGALCPKQVDRSGDADRPALWRFRSGDGVQ
jgi:hypothetical protein